MKFSLNINQPKALELGLNLHQAIILDFLSRAALWAKAEQKDNDTFYWCARQTICKELPILKLKPDTVYRHFKILAELDLINYCKNGKKDLFRLTEKAKSYYVGNRSENDKNTISEIDPSLAEKTPKFGNRSEIAMSEIDPKTQNPDLFPTDHKRLNNIKKSKKEKFNPKQMLLPTWLDYKTWCDFTDHRFELKKPLTQLAAEKTIQQLQEFKAQGYEPASLINISIANGWQGVFKHGKPNNETNQRTNGNDSPADRAVRKAREMLAH